MATGGLPQSQLSLGSCGVEEKRSTCGPLGLDTTVRETEQCGLPTLAGLRGSTRRRRLTTYHVTKSYKIDQKSGTTSLAMEHRRPRTSRKLKPGGEQLQYIHLYSPDNMVAQANKNNKQNATNEIEK